MLWKFNVIALLLYILTSLVRVFFMLSHIYNLHYTNCTHLDQFYIQCEWHNELVYVVNSSWNCCSLETLIGLANVILTYLQQCSWPTCHFSSDYDTCSGISNHYMSSEAESCLPKLLVRSDLWGKFLLQSYDCRHRFHQVTCQLWSLPNSVDVQQL